MAHAWQENEDGHDLEFAICLPQIQTSDADYILQANGKKSFYNAKIWHIWMCFTTDYMICFQYHCMCDLGTIASCANTVISFK